MLCFIKIIKDFYLLGRGELYQAFIDLAQHMLKTPPSAVTEHGIHKHFNIDLYYLILITPLKKSYIHITYDF